MGKNEGQLIKSEVIQNETGMCQPEYYFSIK